MIRSANIHVTGTVQGVGFRPFVYKTAKRNLVSGWVMNASDGVHIHVEGSEDLVEGFLHDLEFDAPSAARIQNISVEASAYTGCSGFEIRESETLPSTRTHIPPDMATCDDCLSELFDENDRRYHYPFINCTNCGPRFTIITDLPYDRPSTSMRNFIMCNSCVSEYTDPSDRRFHAQPNACFDCGPWLTLTYSEDESASARKDSAHENARANAEDACSDTEINRAEKHAADNEPDWDSLSVDQKRELSDQTIAKVASLLKAGKIVAIKGLGGYHLACDATNGAVVSALRERKHRYGKPLAIMVKSVDVARNYCKVSEAEEQIMKSPACPIVLLERTPHATATSSAAALAKSVAGELHEIGVMLPYTPLQHLLMHQLDIPLVMTSGNFTEEPIVASEQAAHKKLAHVADAFLDNNRPIVSRYDDSVVRVVGETLQVVRRARGYSPSPIAFPDFGCSQTVLGVGPEQKCTFTLTACSREASQSNEPENQPHEASQTCEADQSCEADQPCAAGQPCEADQLREADQPRAAGQLCEAYVSQHIGDLENADTMESWQSTLELYEKMFELAPDAIAHDMHPEYLSTKWALEQQQPAQKIAVQHHHAHIAAVMGEQICAGALDNDEPVIGIALDGTGLGTDGTIWGGEILVCSPSEFRRFAHLATFPIAGGSQAIKHPARLAFALLSRLGLLDHPGAAHVLDVLGASNPGITGVLSTMIERGINCVETSSAGRLLDAMSAILGICCDASFDGEAPMLLEAAAYDPASNSLLQACDTDEETSLGYDAWEKRYEFSIERNNEDGDNPSASISAGIDASAVFDTSTSDGELTINPKPTVAAVLDDILAGTSAGVISLRFHVALAHAMAKAAEMACSTTGICKVALSGGVFMNRIIFTQVHQDLENHGITVLDHRELPPNDGCISYGQAVVAAARLASSIDGPGGIA